MKAFYALTLVFLLVVSSTSVVVTANPVADSKDNAKGDLPKNLIIAHCPFPITWLCTNTYEPVCGYQKNGSYANYTNYCNSCYAQIYGYTNGVCPPPPSPSNPSDHCHKKNKPVCGTKDGVLTNYTSKWEAELDKATDITRGYCPRPCPYAMRCMNIYAPVCGTDVYNKRTTFVNICTAGGNCAEDIVPYPCGAFVCTAKFTATCDPNVKTKVGSCGGKAEGKTTAYANNCQACKAGSEYTVLNLSGVCPGPQ